MEMFRRFFFAAVLAGIVAGLFSSALQQWRLVPLILQAEEYEITTQSERVDALILPGDAQGTPTRPTLQIPQTDAELLPLDTDMMETEESWMPQAGFERAFYTVVSTLLVSLGFAFLLVGISVLANLEITATNGILWGLAGFLTFSLMPAIGLPPELPGMEAADLGMRQFWWWATVLSTGAALMILARFTSPLRLPIAMALLFIPHFVGAPPAPTVQSDVPAILASTFAANTLFAALAFWVALGVLYGWLNQRNLQKNHKLTKLGMSSTK